MSPARYSSFPRSRTSPNFRHDEEPESQGTNPAIQDRPESHHVRVPVSNSRVKRPRAPGAPSGFNPLPRGTSKLSPLMGHRSISSPNWFEEPPFVLPPTVPYLVLGFGHHETKVSSSEHVGSVLFSRSSVVLRNQDTIVQVDTHDCVPWSNDHIKVYGYAHTAKVCLPPFTTVVGLASGLNCFPDCSMTLIQIPTEKCNVVEFPDGTKYSRAQGIIYPASESYPEEGNIICRRIKGMAPENHLISAGFALTPNCKFRGPISENEPQFYILGEDHAVREHGKGTSTTLHNPCKFKDLPDCLTNLELTGAVGINVRKKGVPYFVAIFSVLLLALPGVVQAKGSQDNGWGDIVNAIIGTGSVLVGLVLVTFQKIVGFDITSNLALRGVLTIRSNLGARLFARKTVQDIAELACDPRIPPGLVAKDKNCAVRSDRSGWLKIGQSIKFSEMEEHGYVPLKDSGQLLDLIHARSYQCGKKGNVLRIYRPGQELGEDVCERFTGREVFEGD